MLKKKEVVKGNQLEFRVKTNVDWSDFKPEILIIHLKKLQSESFSVSLINHRQLKKMVAARD